MCFDFFYKFYVRNLSFQEELLELFLQMWKRLHVRYLLFLPDFSDTWIFSTDFSKRSQISNFIRIHPVGVESFHVDRRTDGNDEANNLF